MSRRSSNRSRDDGQGWHKESRRHALAAKGVRTGRAIKTSTAYAYNYAKPRKLTEDEYEYKLRKEYLKSKDINSLEEYQEVKQAAIEYRKEYDKKLNRYEKIKKIRLQQMNKEILELEKERDTMRQDYMAPEAVMDSRQLQSYEESRYYMTERKQKLITEMRALASEGTVIRDIDIEIAELEADIKANRRYYYPKGGIK